MTAQHFADNGFFAAVDARGLALDLAAVNLDLAAISAGDAVPGLREGGDRNGCCQHGREGEGLEKAHGITVPEE